MVRKVCLKQMVEKPARQAQTLAFLDSSNLEILEFLAKQGHPVPSGFQKFFTE